MSGGSLLISAPARTSVLEGYRPASCDESKVQYLGDVRDCYEEPYIVGASASGLYFNINRVEYSTKYTFQLKLLSGNMNISPITWAGSSVSHRLV